MRVREERDDDAQAIRKIHIQAFGQVDEADLVDALRAGDYTRLSLVAEVNGEVAGHILFSDLPIQTMDGVVSALALAPLAVLPDCQRQGVGSELIRVGLETCRELGHQIVVVLGQPEYYCRFGFSSDLAQALESSFNGEAFMALSLTAEGLEGVTGRVRYPPPFGVE